MKGFNLFTMILLVVGIVLIYAGVQGASPADVFKNALKGKPTAKSTMNANGTGAGGGSSFDPKNTNAGSGGGGGGGGGSSW